MECLKQVDPSGWQDVPILRQFESELPSNPYCTNSKGFCYIRTKSHAIKHKYIQPNHPAVCRWLFFDIDKSDALFAYYDLGLPPPQIIIKNKTDESDNGHAHYGFRLFEPVGIGGRSSVRAQRYLASVQHALSVALGADVGYTGNLIKNPFSNTYDVYITGAPPSYTLSELADKIDLNYNNELDHPTPANDAGFGRNCSLFDELRHIAYRLPDKSYNAVLGELEPLANKINARFDVPLLPNELKHIVRSIARFCARSDFTQSHKRFSELQAVRGAKGGTAKGKAYDNKRQQAEELHRKGVKQKDIAEQLNVTARTLRNWGIQRKK